MRLQNFSPSLSHKNVIAINVGSLTNVHAPQLKLRLDQLALVGVA
jgi:hypothetical protein